MQNGVFCNIVRFDPKVNLFDKSIQMSAKISCSCTSFCWLWTSTERSTNEFWLKWWLNAIVSKQREREQCLAPIVYGLCKSVKSFEKVDMVSRHVWKLLVKSVKTIQKKGEASGCCTGPSLQCACVERGTLGCTWRPASAIVRRWLVTWSVMVARISSGLFPLFHHHAPSLLLFPLLYHRFKIIHHTCQVTQQTVGLVICDLLR